MRRTLLSACMLLGGSCVSVPPGEGFQSCDVIAAGDYDSRFGKSALTRDDVNRGVNAVLDGANMTTDWRLFDTTENCRKLMGYRVFTKAEPNYILPGDKALIAGHTVCFLKTIVIGTPNTGDFRQSSLVHELFHALQGCEGIPPTDPGVESPFHDNWIRDGIYRAIDFEATQP